MYYPEGSRNFNEVTVGMSGETRARTMTETLVTLYSGLVGDYHPMHADKKAAEVTGGRAVQGKLVLSIADYMQRADCPFEGVGYGFETVRFTHPVTIGDTIMVEWEVTDKRELTEESGRYTIHQEVCNQNDEIVAVYDTVRTLGR